MSKCVTCGGLGTRIAGISLVEPCPRCSGQWSPRPTPRIRPLRRVRRGEYETADGRFFVQRRDWVSGAWYVSATDEEDDDILPGDRYPRLRDAVADLDRVK